MRLRHVTVALALALLVTGLNARADFNSWLANETGKSTELLLKNISPPGTARGVVVASPSRQDPDYFFHWIRDAGLVMDTVVSLYEKSSGADRARYEAMLFDYVNFSRGNQLTPNRSGGADDRGLGEPKFNVDGSAFTGDWGRPQNDGPAIRAIALTRFARDLLAQGRESDVRGKLYDGILPARTVIKADLEFVSHHWQETSFDLWEEVRGKHFYTQLVQRRALVEGAILADQLGDGGAATWYRSQAQELERELNRHWSDGQGYLLCTLDRDGGLDYKGSNLDTSVVVAILHAASHIGNDRFFAASDDRVLATAEKLVTTFQGIYPINQRQRNDAGEALGSALGRYPEDRYSGTTWDNAGNPWVLLTAALGELSYRAAHQFEGDGMVRTTPRNLAFLRRALTAVARGTAVNLQAGETLRRGEPRFTQLLAGLRETGDAFLRRVQLHGNADGSLSEQINRGSGYMQSARDLSWSYAAIMTAAWQR